ncbi:MAG: protein-L-isoaspartate(D-aspartate) O-methyltransferase [Ignavibacteriales bacterium]|nr:protein-L-isoaspartate(D-aspartate) O-methyltransferase [Ignavibacteriales bacterium]
MHALILILILCLSAFLQDDPYVQDRERMVRTQIEMRGIKDQAALSSMKKVQRHLFVPKDLRDNAYDDRPLPIGYGQTISQPFIVAYMTEIIRPNKNSKMLEIGTGSGYQAAVLAEIISDVYTIEIITELSNSSEKRLKELSYKNVYVKNADGYYGWKEHAPFDAIIVTAASEYIPPPLIEQLKDGGRMIIPVGSPFQTQMLMLVEKKDGKVTTKSLMPVIFVPFKRSK